MNNTTIWLCIPFVGLLFCVAVLPLVKAAWWEKNKPIVVALWSLMFIIGFGISHGVGKTTEIVLECMINDYATFIILLFGLFCVAGNIRLKGDLAGSPRVNVVLLIIGTFLASMIGTTGASMLMVRPVIKMNAWRKRRSHIMIFFIFLVSNIGGCLTPIGDPPLLMGFSRGVPFFWSMHLLPVLIVNMVIILMIFHWIDTANYRKDIADGLMPNIEYPRTRIKLQGAHNFIFIIMIVASVILSGVLPKLPMFQDKSGEVIGIKIYGDVRLTVVTIIEMAIILLAAFLSFKTTKKEVRVKNHFTWGPIEEVAILFIGIFITMQPALMLLRDMGSSLGITHPAQFFWATGMLSSFLDNTPTYLVSLTTAGAMSFQSGIVTTVGTIPTHMLMAISCGAVFMGANTYIGNAPNFMVKSISDENGISMPSFFGYMKWSLGILVPVFLLDTLLFFLH